MYKKIVRFICLLLLPVTGISQVTMSVQVPPSGVMQKNQLWNLVLISTSATPVYVNLQLTLLSTKDNNAVMTAVSNNLLVKKGSTQLTINELAPVQYTYLSSIFNVDRNPNGFLPVGNFQACYSLNRIEGEVHNSNVMAEECIPLEVIPLSPPLLNTPFDKDTVSLPYPQFTWLPPVPVNLFNDLTYDIALVKVMPNQSPMQAAQQNIPVYSMGNLRDISNIYPASAKALDTAQWYAWRIVASNNRQFVAQSDVWSFFVAGDSSIPVVVVNDYFILLRKEQEANGTTVLPTRKVGIKYYSYESKHQSIVRIFNSAGQLMKEQMEMIVYGDNFFNYDLDRSFKSEEKYTIVITDTHHTIYKASISIQ